MVPFSAFNEVLSEPRSEHPKASHHCTAFRHMNDHKQVVEGAKDDGEPGGTAGTPMLRVLQGSGLMDIGAIVVRYFGGTKLGTGGLTRAYGGAVRQAVDQANFAPWYWRVTHVFKADFAHSAELERKLAVLPEVEILNRNFTEQGVEVAVVGPEDIIANVD